eukprot:363706-Chlamydomonas_euryale.AAC.1
MRAVEVDVGLRLKLVKIKVGVEATPTTYQPNWVWFRARWRMRTRALSAGEAVGPPGHADVGSRSVWCGKHACGVWRTAALCYLCERGIAQKG